MFSASKTKGASSGYQVANSLRFRASASAYLNRTFGTPTNNKIWTYSLWVKRGSLGSEQELLNANSNNIQFYFSTSNTLNFYDGTSGASYYSTQVFRDPSAWYHILVSVDTTQATAGNRVRIYVNGSQITAFSTGTAPGQNNSSAFNVASTIHVIGRYNPTTVNYLDGYMADINFIDGQALTPSSFGQINATTGVWQPIRYSGTYGTNGFKLNFSNGTSTTTLGYDSSGNSNNWTTNNISLTAGSTYDWMLDSPTPFAGSSYGVGNYAVLNPVGSGSTVTLSNANLQASITATSNSRSTIGVNSGKWYCEAVSTPGTAGAQFGLLSSSAAITNFVGQTAASWGYGYNGSVLNNNASIATYSSYTTNDVISVAFDADTGKLYFAKNGTWQGSSNPATSTNPVASGITGSTYFFGVSDGTGGGAAVWVLNFGQRPFAYTPPTGFKALCTQNLPTPSIVNGASYMAATTYTGNGSTQSISNAVNGVSFQPDLFWAKSRSTTDNNILYDSVRGVSKYLSSNLTIAEGTASGVTSFNSNGVTVGSDPDSNRSSATYVGWQWKAGGTAVTNTAGSITSQVSANTTAGFSVVTFTCNAGGSGTFGHGLGVAPSMVIIKSRTTATSWFVGHTAIGWTNYLFLNTTAASAASTSVWNDTSPSSTVVTLGSGFTSGVYGSMVAYCFAAIPGYSAFGSYTGNGSTDGPFVYCGFRPRWILIKSTQGNSSYDYWFLWDTTRSPYNYMDKWLFPNAALAEDSGSAAGIDALSNGFKVRNSFTGLNTNGVSYIYAAFAENPFQNALAR